VCGQETNFICEDTNAFLEFSSTLIIFVIAGTENNQIKVMKPWLLSLSKLKKMRFYKKDSNSVHQQSPYKFDVTANLYKKIL
jgi:hypothetical protein